MREVVRITVLPDLRLVRVVNEGINGYCLLRGLSKTQAGELQFALEEVFAYCVQTIKKDSGKSRITVILIQEPGVVRIFVEHKGPVGPLDKYFKPGTTQTFKRNTFEALGMSMAQKFLDTLAYDYWHKDGVNRFTLTYGLAARGGPVDEV